MDNYMRHYYLHVVDAIKAVREYLKDQIMPDDIEKEKTHEVY